MSTSLIPKRIYSSVLDLTPQALLADGVLVLFADLDNTLARYKQSAPTPEILRWKQSLNEHGITLFVVSNSRKPTRASIYCEQLGIDFIGHAGKPKRAGFERAMARTGFQPSQAAMVGDQIFTDVLGANNAGIRSYLVHPVAIDNVFRALRYAFEGLFRIWCRDDRRKNAVGNTKTIEQENH